MLVAEDHEDMRFLLRYLLEARGCRVLEAEDGERALDAALRERPDLILMDGSLPRLDGYTATRRLRETDALRKVPVVFLSGHAGSDYRHRAISAGGDDYLVKPLDTAQMDRVLARHLFKNKA